ncbi:quinon protein alcohol dehydrogenase-like superfamily [Aspergillus filifer]
MKERDVDNRLLQDLCLTDPRDDMERIEQSKGRLLVGSCSWVLTHKDFTSWRDGNASPLFWIKGNPGKGKTMLMIGIIQEMLQATQDTGLVSFFFCQNTDPNLDNATAILRGLIYQLAVQENALISYIRSDYDSRGRLLFEGANAFFALSRILSKILDHPSLPKVYLIVDALDECQTDLQPLLELIMQHTSPRLRWLVSSRPRDEIGGLLSVDSYTELDLDRDAIKNVRTVVSAYIDYEVANLARQKKYSPTLQEEIKDYLQLHADDTFLWVALVCQQLRQTILWKTLSVLKSFPSGLKPLYQRMMEGMKGLVKESPEVLDYCRRILAAVTLALRPLHLSELGLVAGLEPELAEDHASLVEIVGLCGNFVFVRKETVYFVHQSAKDYLSTHGRDEIFSKGVAAVHSEIVSQALKEMANTLHRDIWGLHEPGYYIKAFQTPVPDPLAHTQYVCTHWIDHICELDTDTQQDLGLCDGGEVGVFFQKHLLHWLEALSLLRRIGSGVEMISKLEHSLTRMSVKATQLLPLVTDAKHFVDYHQHVIAAMPLQVYSSALVFSPASSHVKRLFKDQIPSWISRAPSLDRDWELHISTMNLEDAIQPLGIAYSPRDEFVAICYSTRSEVYICNVSTKGIQKVLYGHTSYANSVAFSRDGALLASGSKDGVILIWSIQTGQVVQTFKCQQEGRVECVVFSGNDNILVSRSVLVERPISVWDVQTGEHLRFLDAHTEDLIFIGVSSDAQITVSDAHALRIWDAYTGALKHTLVTEIRLPALTAVSPDGDVAIHDEQIQIWNARDGKVEETFAEFGHTVLDKTFSPVGKRLAVGLSNGGIQTWESGKGSWSLAQALETGNSVEVVRFSGDGRKIAFISGPRLHVWDTAIPESRHTLPVHSTPIMLITASPCGKWLATGTVKEVDLWDRATGLLVRTYDTNHYWTESLEFSHDGSLILCMGLDGNIVVWATETGDTVLTFHTHYVNQAILSPDGRRVLSSSRYGTVYIWNLESGELEKTIEADEYLWSPFAWSSNGLLFASSSPTGIKIWNTETRALQKVLADHNHVKSIAFSDDGRYLACTTLDCLWVYDIETGVPLHALDPGFTSAEHLRFSEDGSRLRTKSGCIALPSEPSFRDDDDYAIPAEWVGYGLNYSMEITWDGKPILKLPAEYVGQPFLVQDHMVSLADRAGYVMIFEFDEDIAPL